MVGGEVQWDLVSQLGGRQDSPVAEDVDKEIATEIVRRYNCYKGLLDACKKALDLIEVLEYAGETVRESNYKFLIAAIADAEGKL